MPKVQYLRGSYEKVRTTFFGELKSFFQRNVFRSNELENGFTKAAEKFGLEYDAFVREYSGYSGRDPGRFNVLTYHFYWQVGRRQRIDLYYGVLDSAVWFSPPKRVWGALESWLKMSSEDLHRLRGKSRNQDTWDVLVYPEDERDHYLPWGYDEDPDPSKYQASPLLAKQIRRTLEILETEMLRDRKLLDPLFGFWFFSLTFLYLISLSHLKPWYFYEIDSRFVESSYWEEFYRKASSDPVGTLEKMVGKSPMYVGLYSPMFPRKLFWVDPDSRDWERLHVHFQLPRILLQFVRNA